MPKATLPHTTGHDPQPSAEASAAAPGRRGLLGGVALALAGTGGGALAVPVLASPDAELLQLGVSLEAAWVQQDDMPARCSEEEFDAAMEACGAIVDRIEHMPAHTIEGLMVKARAISWCNSGEEIDPDRFCPYPGATTDGRIAAAIVRDLLRRA